MDANDREPKRWSNTRTYMMAAICLVLGFGVGYLMRTPPDTSSITSATTAMPSQPSPGRMSAAPSAQDMKRMADKQVAPMLAELQKNPNDAELLAKIGRAYLAAQQYENAQQYYEKSISLRPDAENMNALSFVQYSLGNVDKAVGTLNDAIKLDPKNSKLLFNLGMFEWHGKSDPRAAITAWQQLIKVNPKDPKRAQVEKMIAQAKQHLNIAPGTKTDKPAM